MVFGVKIFPVLFVISALLLAAACGGPKPVITAYHKKETSLSKKAKAEYGKARYEKALKLYTEALNASRALDDPELIAINLINISSVYRKMGQTENSIRTADEILEATHVSYPQEYISQAQIIKSQVYKDMGKYAIAREFADSALKTCQASSCNQSGRIYNLKAKIAILEGDLKAADAFSSKGLDIVTKAEDHNEIANSLRIKGEVKIKQKRYQEAGPLLEEALAGDKKYGRSRKIALDLILLGRLFDAQGKSATAQKYYKRALSVSVGDDDEDGVKRAKKLLGRTD